MRVSFLLSLIILVFGSPVVYADGNPASGEELFRSTSLGTNGKSCSTCHPQGKGLENIADYDDAILQEIVNFCIRDALKGEMLSAGAAELSTIGAYLRRFQKSE